MLEGAERDEALRGHIEVLETFRREGMPAAMKLMWARSGVDPNDREAEVPAPSVSTANPKAIEQHFANLRHFLTSDVPAVTRYQPDIAAVTAARSKIIPAIGSATSPSALAYRCAVALAGVLHRTPVKFPGGHTAFMLCPKAVAQRIRELIRQEAC